MPVVYRLNTDVTSWKHEIFVARTLASWLQHNYVRLVIVACILIIAATRYMTIIRPRYFSLGRDRRIAECVAGHMHSGDLFVAAEKGWPDYLPYIHKRAALNIINEFARFRDKQRTLKSVHEAIAKTHKRGDIVYMEDPRSYTNAHLQWLEERTGVTAKDLSGIAGTPSFVCEAITINLINN